MSDLTRTLANLRRPRALLRAARHGIELYDRSRCLRRLTGRAAAPDPETALSELLSLESDLEERRKAGRVAYSVGRHIEVLAAIIAETRLVPGLIRDTPPG